MRTSGARGSLTLGMVAILIAACSGSPGASAAATTVAVTLQEWAVGTVPQSAPSGNVTFNVTNTGPDDIHEFVVIRTDLSLIDLPTDETGAVSESGEGMEVVNEIEDIAVGSSETLTVALDAGAYVLICNIYDEEEQEAHYQEGMRTSFDVT